MIRKTYIKTSISFSVGYFILGLAIGMIISLKMTNLSFGYIIMAMRSEVDPHLALNSYHSRQAVNKEGNINIDLKKDEHHHRDNDTLAKALKCKVRVLVWVMTSPDNLKTKAKVVRDTWGRRCNKILFFSSKTNTEFPAIGLNTSEGRAHLTAKTMEGFRYVYDNHFDDADWFMKVDDDTFVIVENLRYFLSKQNTSLPIYFGHHFKTLVRQGYYSGGGGYVLSKESLQRLATKGRDSFLCRQDGGAEDAELGRCMERLGVRTASSADAMGRSRFHCFDAETHLSGGFPKWYYRYDANGAKMGAEHVSDYAISFHYIPPSKMLALDYYIYHLQPYGIIPGIQDLNRKNIENKKT